MAENRVDVEPRHASARQQLGRGGASAQQPISLGGAEAQQLLDRGGTEAEEKWIERGDGGYTEATEGRTVGDGAEERRQWSLVADEWWRHGS